MIFKIIGYITIAEWAIAKVVTVALCFFMSAFLFKTSVELLCKAFEWINNRRGDNTNTENNCRK